MREGFNSKAEGSNREASDSDRYCLGNLDLLNLRVNFSSDDCNRKNRRSRETGSGDDYCKNPRHPHQHHRAVKHTALHIGDQAFDRPVPKQKQDSGADQLQLLYTNRNYFDGEKHIRPIPPRYPKKVEEEFFRRPRYSLLKPRNIEIYTTDAMAHRTLSSKRQHSLTNAGGSFPFKVTPSGNFKVDSQQVVFESEKLSVLVADPKHTKVKIKPDSNEEIVKDKEEAIMANETDFSKSSAVDAIMSQAGITSLGSIIAGNIPVRNTKELPEYEAKETSEILDPELNLGRLGFRVNEAINWERVTLPEKKNLYLELYARITNYTNADCKVYIDNEEFNCHLIVLQCYSELFDEYVAVKKVELASDKCSPESFAFIYEWMITGEPSYKELTRDNVLDVFNSAKYLKIKDLVEQCWAFIDNNEVFNEDTAYLLYMDAKEKNLPEVRELMLPRIQHFFLMLVSSQDWLEMDIEDVKQILRSNYIRVNCEMEVFMSAVRWLKHDWSHRDQYKFELLSCIRFGNIAPWQLVDIKRNPDNPDFMELAKDPIICKMIDDGLAFVIIKYWYGQENDDFQHWNKMLGLQEPPPRNWSGTEKAYFTYREFLIYLDQYRRTQMIEKSKPRSDKNRVDAKTSPKPSIEKVPPRIPTMDEFLLKKKSGASVFSMLNAKTQLPMLQKTAVKKYTKMSQNQAATAIQRRYRGYRERKMLEKKYPYIYKQLREIRERLGTIQEGTANQAKVLKMFTPSKNYIARTRMNELSASALGPEKEYITETSLFLPDRESVVVFGGIDPHSNYGVGRNTGRDIFRYLPDYNIWEYVGDLPEPRHHHSVAFLKGRVYLCGGADPRDDDVRGKSVVVDTVWSFEPVKRCWFSEGSLVYSRKNFGLVVTNQTMFAIGGQDRLGRTIGSVEQFNPLLGSWHAKASLRYPRMGIACAKYRDFIWAAGGLSGSKTNPLSDIVESYDIKTDQWTEITRLRFPRCFSRLFVISDRLYLIGGAGRTTEQDKTTASVGTIDVWDIHEAAWKHMTEMAIPRHGHAVAYLGTQILIIGGVTTIYMRALSNTECFCSQRATWIRGIACLPTPLSGHAAVTLPPAMLMTN